MISLTSPPPALTPAELAILSADTPTTFEGIPPLLRHLESSIEFFIDPPFEEFASGNGSLYITEGFVLQNIQFSRIRILTIDSILVHFPFILQQAVKESQFLIHKLLYMPSLELLCDHFQN